MHLQINFGKNCTMIQRREIIIVMIEQKLVLKKVLVAYRKGTQIIE